MIAAMQGELQREMAILGKADPAAYYLGYTLTDSDHAEVVGSNGALLNSQQSHNRWLEAEVRVGGFDLDNTHSTGNGQRGPARELRGIGAHRRRCRRAGGARCGERPTRNTAPRRKRSSR